MALTLAIAGSPVVLTTIVASACGTTITVSIVATVVVATAAVATRRLVIDILHLLSYLHEIVDGIHGCAVVVAGFFS